MTPFNGDGANGGRDSGGGAANKMMLAFIIRQCEIDLGHPPTAAELAAWANDGGHTGRTFRLFGRSISEAEARVMLRRRARLVSAKAPESFAPVASPAETSSTGTVVMMAEARERLAARTSRPARARTRLKRPRA